MTEELLEKTFSQFGKLERVKKLKDYAFVHFEDRDAAVKVRLCCYIIFKKKFEAITKVKGFVETLLTKEDRAFSLTGL